jgi:hypothetical protein
MCCDMLRCAATLDGRATGGVFVKVVMQVKTSVVVTCRQGMKLVGKPRMRSTLNPIAITADCRGAGKRAACRT